MSKQYTICDTCQRKNTTYCSECMYKHHPSYIIHSYYDNYIPLYISSEIIREQIRIEKSVTFKNKGEKRMEDYKTRFKNEYKELKEKYDKLDAMTVKYEAGTLNFTPSCSLELLLKQKKHMGNYLRVLKVRAEIENIEL